MYYHFDDEYARPKPKRSYSMNVKVVNIQTGKPMNSKEKNKKIVLVLKTGITYEFHNCTEKQFQHLVKIMKRFSKSFLFDEKIWIRKSEVASFELVTNG